jgi:hypothetical protein
LPVGAVSVRPALRYYGGVWLDLVILMVEVILNLTLPPPPPCGVGCFVVVCGCVCLCARARAGAHSIYSEKKIEALFMSIEFVWIYLRYCRLENVYVFIPRFVAERNGKHCSHVNPCCNAWDSRL